MKHYRIFLTAVRALRRNLLRAVLTTLGVIIGIAAVIAMMEIGTGSSNAIRKSISSMGANVLMVTPGTAASGGVSFGSGSVMTMTPEDAQAIENDCPAVKDAAPLVRTRAQIVYGSRNWVPMTIYGTTPSFLPIRAWSPVAEGANFTERDVRTGNRVCVIGQTIKRELFEGKSPIGKEIRILNVAFRVVGVLTAKGSNMMGMDQDDIVLAPWTAIKYRVSGSTLGDANASNQATSSTSDSPGEWYPAGSVELYPAPSATEEQDRPLPVRFANVDRILAGARSAEQAPAAVEEITKLLRERHRIRPGEPDDFTVRNMNEIMSALTSTTRLMKNLLLGVALISLIVGGVGIMNIMLVSVTERTREIGLRMAVGAHRGDILRQFLIEAVVLCLVGGVLGIAMGRGISLTVAALLHWPIAASLDAVIAAVVVSVSVGVLFGFYPAVKASRLDPIEALRYE